MGIVYDYLAAAMWSSGVDGVSALEIPTYIEKRAKEYLDFMLTKCEEKGMKIPERLYQQFGHDLWLTHEGHGCGFWDGDWDGIEVDGELVWWGDTLTEMTKEFPSTLQCTQVDEDVLIQVENIFNYNYTIIDGKAVEIRYKKLKY